MNEQHAYQPGMNTRQHEDVQPSTRQRRFTLVPPADEEDERLYQTRLPSSVRRYPAAQTDTTAMRVTYHPAPPPQRASKHQPPPPNEQPRRVLVTPPPARSQQPPEQQQRAAAPHLLVYVGVGMLIMLAMWVAGSGLWQWWQGQQDSMRYSYPRTYQCDADVKHGGVSHFTVENLNGHIIITEVRVNDLPHTKVYSGPLFSGPGSDQNVATIHFQDVNGDGYPDMIIVVGNGRYVLLNDHSGFRPTTPADKFTQEVK